MTKPEPKFLNLRIWDQSALVLMNWLLETDETTLSYSHPGQKQALRDLLFALESTRGLGFTDEELSLAQTAVARDMSDEDRNI